jgi:hypothetical protein
MRERKERRKYLLNVERAITTLGLTAVLMFRFSKKMKIKTSELAWFDSLYQTGRISAGATKDKKKGEAQALPEAHRAITLGGHRVCVCWYITHQAFTIYRR